MNRHVPGLRKHQIPDMALLFQNDDPDAGGGRGRLLVKQKEPRYIDRQGIANRDADGPIGLPFREA